MTCPTTLVIHERSRFSIRTFSFRYLHSATLRSMSSMILSIYKDLKDSQYSSEKAVKFITCGHVDDGKSTLLGRLLFEMDVLPEDQIAGATENGVLDYSRLTDGLEDERAQGITIDVAYRYVRHNGRNYRFADTPGHLQYFVIWPLLHQMVMLQSFLIDAAHGVREQTLRHAKIAAFFGIKDFVLAINKMDKIDY